MQSMLYQLNRFIYELNMAFVFVFMEEKLVQKFQKYEI